MNENNKKLKVICINSDSGGCFTYRISIPFTEQRKYGVEYIAYPYLPRIPEGKGGVALETYIRFLLPYDLVIVQRCYKYEIMAITRHVCDILGKPLIFETDDDYLNIPSHNPCHAEMAVPGQDYKFKEILRMADYVTVTTDELKSVYYQYNKNIMVLPNNVENVHFFKDIGEVDVDHGEKFSPLITQGFMHFPSYVKREGAALKVIRIGYTCNSTHRADFETIKHQLFKVLEKKRNKVAMIYYGDAPDARYPEGYFFAQHVNAIGKENVVSMPGSNYFMYLMNIRNFDIGLAPLEFNMFNMSKSPIKAIEYASWGIPAVLPNYVTYTREFTHNKNCLVYDNSKEFYDCLMTYIEDFELREKHGNDGRLHVGSNRVERLPQNGRKRNNFYNKVMGMKRPIDQFDPEVEKNDKAA